MKMVLHYLKFDFLRWRWLVVALWGLVLLHAVLFYVAEWSVRPAWKDDRWNSERYFAEATVVITNGTLLWAMALVIFAGATDSPVRRRTWLMTRAGNRWLRAGSRLGFVLLCVVLPLAIAYAVMPLAAGFDAQTVLHSFWLALETAAPLAAALWLWVRVWPHVPGLLVGALSMISFWTLGYAGGLRLPVEWFAMLPSLPVVACCLALPALVCLRTAGRMGRPAVIHGWLAGLLLPVMWVASGVVSHGLRSAFPGNLESAVLGHGDWTMTPASDRPLGHDLFPLQSDVPFSKWAPDWVAVYSPAEPAVSHAQILATSWQRQGEQDWSPWREAGGEIQNGSEGLALHITGFETEGLSGEEHITLRLKTRVMMSEKKTLILPPGAGAKVRGHGWIYETTGQTAEPGWSLLERGRVAAGMRIAVILAGRGRESASHWSPTVHGYHYRARTWLPGYHFVNRDWNAEWVGRDREKADHLAREPVRLVLTEVETCLRIVRVESVRVLIKDRGAEPVRVPRAAPVDRAPEVEPFPGYVSSIVWPPDQSLAVPDAHAAPHEVAYFIHWLKTREEIPEPQQAALLVPSWRAQFLEIATLQELPLKNALLQVLTAGFPEEYRIELLTLLPKASWLAPVVEKRGWQTEAKPFLLESARRTGRIHDEFIPLVHGYRDPAFNKWMRKTFKLNVPTVLYWESMPELEAELRARLKGESRGWPSMQQSERDALLTGGSPDYLGELLKSLNDRKSSLKVGAGFYLYSSVIDASGDPPPPTGLVLRDDGQPDYRVEQRLAPEFLQWFAGLTVDDFTFDREKRRFVRKSTAPKAP